MEELGETETYFAGAGRAEHVLLEGGREGGNILLESAGREATLCWRGRVETGEPLLGRRGHTVLECPGLAREEPHFVKHFVGRVREEGLRFIARG